MLGSMKNDLLPGMGTLYDSSKLIGSAVSQIYDGLKTASDGGATLNTATGKVTDGIGKLYDGSVKLNDGMQEYKEKAIDEIEDAANNTLPELQDRVKQTVSLAGDYTIYTDSADGASTSVKFIYESEAIEME